MVVERRRRRFSTDQLKLTILNNGDDRVYINRVKTGAIRLSFYPARGGR